MATITNTGNRQTVEDELQKKVINDYSALQSLCPEFEFKQVRGCSHKYESHYCLNGERRARPDKSYITNRDKDGENDPFIYEQGGGSVNLIAYIMQRNGITRNEACKKMCEAVGEDYDTLFSKADTKEWREWKGLQEKYKEIHKQMQADLYTPDGQAVLDYMHGRGWTDEDIKRTGIGLLTEQTERQLFELRRTVKKKKDDKEITYLQPIVGYNNDKNEPVFANTYKRYPVVIPFISQSIYRGFKFRVIQATYNKDGKELPKYKNTNGLPKSSYLLGFNPVVKSEWTEVVLVEGDLDALLAQAKGLHNFVSLTGKDGHDEQIQALKDAGVKRVTIMLDTEATKEKMTDEIYPAISKLADTLQASGITDVYVAQLPAPEGCKMDTADYLKDRTKEELQDIIAGADPYAIFRFNRIAEQYATADGTYKQLSDFKRKVIKTILTDNYTTPEQRQAVCCLFQQYTGGLIQQADIEAEAEAILSAQAQDKQAQVLKDTTTKAVELLKDGKRDEAIKCLQDGTAYAVSLTDTKEVEDFCHIPTATEVQQRLKDMPDAIPTPYYFTSHTGDRVLQLRLQQGALTIIGAMPHHGKTTMLRNLALALAQSDDGQAVWFISFEEDEDGLLVDFVNTYIGEELHRAGNYSQYDTIKNYLRTGEVKYIRGDKVEKLKQGAGQFINDYTATGRLLLKYGNYTLTQFVGLLTKAIAKIPTKAVFIDYVQKLRTSGYSKSRQEELQDVCRALRAFAIEHRLPVVLGAQMTRGIALPTEKRGFNMQAISDSSEIEKEACTIVLLWNSQYNASEDVKDKDSDRYIIDKIGLGTAGHLYATIAKNRHYGGVGYDAVLQFDGATGKVHGNHNSLPQNLRNMLSTDPEQQELFNAEAEAEADDPDEYEVEDWRL